MFFILMFMVSLEKGGEYHMTFKMNYSCYNIRSVISGVVKHTPNKTFFSVVQTVTGEYETDMFFSLSEDDFILQNKTGR